MPAMPNLSYYLSSNLVAFVSHGGNISIIRDPGDLSDDELRVSVNAPLHAVVQRLRRPEPAAPSLHLLTWVCHVCGRDRYDAQVSVFAAPAKHTVPELPDQKVNVRYCNDREQCTTVARTAAVWPPDEAGQWCIPAQNLHATPHRGCDLR